METSFEMSIKNETLPVKNFTGSENNKFFRGIASILSGTRHKVSTVFSKILSRRIRPERPSSAPTSNQRKSNTEQSSLRRQGAVSAPPFAKDYNKNLVYDPLPKNNLSYPKETWNRSTPNSAVINTTARELHTGKYTGEVSRVRMGFEVYYSGGMVNGCKQGKGLLEKDNKLYEGEFVNGFMHGLFNVYELDKNREKSKLQQIKYENGRPVRNTSPI